MSVTNVQLEPSAAAMIDKADGGPSIPTWLTREKRGPLDNERQLAAMLDAVPALVWLTDRAGRYRFVNRAVEELFGRTRDELVGRDDHELWPGEVAKVNEQRDLEVLASARDIDLEEPLRSPDGTRFFGAVKFPLADRDGVPYAVCTLATDVTERVRADEEARRPLDELEVRLAELTSELAQANARLNEAHERLVAAEKLSSIGLLASGVAHEINNPLSGVTGLVKALRGGEIQPQRTNLYLDAMLDGLERMRLATQGLLDLARQRLPTRSSFDTLEMLDSCLRLLSSSIRKKQLRVEVRVPPGHSLYADRSQIMQAVVNVAMNAIYAAPAQTRLTIAAEQRDGRIGLRITDQGAGISDLDIARLCEPLFTTKPEGEGTGLGLAVTQSILHAHGGELTIESAPGAGTSVTLWIVS